MDSLHEPVARTALGPALAAFFASLALRVVLLVAYPDNIGLDGFQRWAGRDWLLVQGWLPGPQLLIWAADNLGLGVEATRIFMAVVASSAVAAGAVLAHAIGGQRAGWMYVGAATFGPFALWGSALYQEGLFLLCLFTGLALALKGHARLGDLVLGALGLVRYEAWPLLLLYVAWRRTPAALVVGWGAAVWLLGSALGWEGRSASPIDYFSDWEGLAARFTVEGWLKDARRLLLLAWHSGALLIGVAALVGLRDRARPTRLVGAMVAIQLGFVAVWMVGLETATARMLIVPTMLAAVVAAVGLARLWDRPGLRRGLVVALVVVAWVSAVNAWRSARTEAAFTEPERAALDQMESCPTCRWWVEPRTGLGPRDRHDGCEILQGISDLRHGEDFLCAPWPGDAEAAGTCHGRVAWDGKAYAVTVTTAHTGSPGPATP